MTSMAICSTIFFFNIFILLLLTYIQIGSALKWEYSGDKGPEFWATLAGGEECGGVSQSPINIDTKHVKKQGFEPWKFQGYEELTAEGTEMHNNGHTVQISLKGRYPFRISGGGLPSTYSATQFHFHWGQDDNEGSEHTRNGAQYPAELHIVHYDSETYFDIFAAIAEPRGLAVLGLWVEVGDENPAFDSIINTMQNVTNKGEMIYFNDEQQIRLNDFLPSNSDMFYRYEGSLTTPDCFESVVWTVFEEPISMSAQQLETLRRLSQLSEEEMELNSEGKPISHNYRPVQPINKRTVYVNTPGVGSGVTAHVPHLLLTFLLLCACYVIKF